MNAELDALLDEPLEPLNTAQRLAVTAQWETLQRRGGAFGHRLVAAVAEAPLAELAEANPRRALSTLLRITPDDAKRRLAEARDLCARRTLTGEHLPPALTHTAAAQRDGHIGAEHIAVIRKFFKKLPGFVDYPTREKAEQDLAELACGLRPDELRKAADRMAYLLDQDGDFSDDDRARRRYLHLGPQQHDGMSEVRGLLDPEGRAVVEAVWANLAAPGMCNPEDPDPCLDGEVTEDNRRADHRSTGQRQHDALKALCRAALGYRWLGSHHGLPTTMVITTTLQDLESGKGFAVTGGGTVLPMSEVIRLAAAAHHYLAVFDKHTNEPLYLARSRRLATKAQRLVLYARDRGCTKPGCTAPAYHSQAHHAQRDWAAGGHTDITDLTLACGPDNRLIETTGWTTHVRQDGRTEWIPPPHLDTGQARTNNYHHPERYLQPDDDP